MEQLVRGGEVVSTPLTHHAAQRMAQRGFRPSDIEVVLLIATEVEGGYFVRENDARLFAEDLRKRAEQIERMAGKRLVIRDNMLVTAYHATPAKTRRLLREKTHRRRHGGEFQ